MKDVEAELDEEFDVLKVNGGELGVLGYEREETVHEGDLVWAEGVGLRGWCRELDGNCCSEVDFIWDDCVWG